jgi:hypothetical protein
MGIIIHRNRNIQENVRIRQDVKNIDLLRGTVAEQQDANVGVYDFSGYHRSTIASYLAGRGGGSPYSRQYGLNGELVTCGLNIYNRMIQQEEMLIQATGEPVQLLRRKWTGELCPCWDKNRQRADTRCPICFGAGFVGGYVPYINPKEPDGRIFIRISPNMEDLKSMEQGMFQANEIQAWTLPIPTLRDRDVIIRFDPHTGLESWRYIIKDVTRNSGLFNTFTAQLFTIIRVDKTYPINYIRVVDLVNNQVGDLLGKGDELQDLIEAEHGDGFQDGGFSLGYFSGYDMGYHDAYYQKPYRSIPDDNIDGFVDDQFWAPHESADAKMEFWLTGYRYGYLDGTDDGDAQRLKIHPPDRLPVFETRRPDIPDNLAGHPNERVIPPTQVDEATRSFGTSGVNPNALPGNPFPSPAKCAPDPRTALNINTTATGTVINITSTTLGTDLNATLKISSTSIGTLI